MGSETGGGAGREEIERITTGRTTTMTPRMVSVTVYMEPEQQEKLSVLNETTRVPIAVYVREGIDLVLLREEGKLAELEKKQEQQLKISFAKGKKR